MAAAQNAHKRRPDAVIADQFATPASPDLYVAHRTDIDGLRAIAVTSVVLLHAGVSIVSGGFLGVDVFFVISGYLIHKDLTRRLAAGTFAPLAFYGRRMRRTLPTLYLVTALTLVAAWFIVLPGDFDAMARSASATVLSVSNIFFLTQVGYFDHDALSKPLLHTWSLGVEEQFYILAPVLSFALYRLRSTLRPIAYLMLFGVTFAFCVGLQKAAPAAAFFLMPARAWEFLIGCAVADGMLPAVRHRGLAEIVTAAALAALICALFLVAEDSAHPGWPTLIPCLATATIIHTGGTCRTTVARLLGLRPIAFIGLISYSLYLWHWPLIVFARYVDLPPTPLLGLAMLALVLALSVLSWRYVERPFRDPASPLRRKAGPILAGGLAMILAGSAGIVTAHGIPRRFPDDVATVSAYYDYADRREFREGTCFLTTKYGAFKYFDKTNCLQRSETKPNYLLIGDSLAAHYWIGLSTVFADANILQATASGCKPILGTPGKAYCVDLVDYTLKDFLPKAHLDGIVFSGAWDIGDAAPLATTVAYAKTYTPNVVVLGNVPLHDMDLPNLLGRSLVEHRPDLVLEHQMDYPWQVEAALKDTIAAPDYISVLGLLCPEQKCVAYASKTAPLQFDKSHLTTEGSILVAQRLKNAGLFAHPAHK